MVDFPHLDESDIQRWVGEGSFARGRDYFQHAHVVNPRRQGAVLKARCIGSRPQPYYVEVMLEAEGIAAGECSCPVGSGGRCKHAAAVLLTWLHQPETFTEIEDLETALNSRSKAELIAAIRRMVARYPDLEMLLELPVVGAGEPRPVDPEAIRRQARQAFYGAGHDEWRAIYGIARGLYQLVGIGHDYARRGQWRDAGIIYQVVIQETLGHYEMVRDEEGDLHGVVDQCVEGLGQCLGATEDATEREAVLRALFDVYRWDIDAGGIDMGYQATDIILEKSAPEERQEVAQWVREALAAGPRCTGDYRREDYGGFLLKLEEDWLDDEGFLRICREMRRWRDLVNRLLTLGRVDEAVAVTGAVSSYHLLGLADLFVSHGHSGLAEGLVRERDRTVHDSRLTEWLKTRAQERGDLDEALDLAEALFWHRPTLGGYQELRGLARSLAKWDDLRAALQIRLAEEGYDHLLTEIHVEEGEVDRALSSLKRVLRSRPEWGSPALSMQVAKAAEETRPREAIRLYVEESERLIAGRGRYNYAQAALHLGRVRDLYHRLGEQATWQSFIADLRERNPRLRALKDELDQAGL